jgi:hypothetical protein
MVSTSTIRSDTFKAVFDLINNNKPTGWTVTSSFIESKPSFPQIVIDPALVTEKNLSLNKSKKSRLIEMRIGLYALTSQRKEKIDEGRDNINNTILNNLTTLRNNNLVPVTFGDVDIDTEELSDDTKVHTGEITIEFKKI